MEHWENFYVIVGSSAAALTGLQFVVITLISTEQAKSTGAEIGVFGTPTVLHFCSVLTVSCILAAPWRDVGNAATAIGIYGGFGIFYCGLVLRRTRQRMSYQPVLEDWIFHAILPFVAYAAVLVSALLLQKHRGALFFIAGAALMLLLLGIRNAWDSVTYIAIDKRKQEQNK